MAVHHLVQSQLIGTVIMAGSAITAAIISTAIAAVTYPA
jgi:hypothetical protein